MHVLAKLNSKLDKGDRNVTFWAVLEIMDNEKKRKNMHGNI